MLSLFFQKKPQYPMVLFACLGIFGLISGISAIVLFILNGFHIVATNANVAGFLLIFALTCITAGLIGALLEIEKADQKLKDVILKISRGVLWFILIGGALIAAGTIVYCYVWTGGKGTLVQATVFFCSSIFAYMAFEVLRMSL
jgi:hypothetical protein